MKKSIYFFLNKLSMTKKIMLIFLGSTLLPISFIMMFSYAETQDEIQTRLLSSLESSLTTSSSEINNVLESAVQLSILYNREDIANFLDKEYSSDHQYIINYQNTFYNYFGFDLHFYEQIVDINFYTNNNTILNGKIVSNNNLPQINGESNIRQREVPLNAEGNIKLIARKSNTFTQLDTKYQYTVVHQTVDEDSERNFEMDVNIVLNSEYIFNIFNNTTSLFSSVIIADENSSILSSSDFSEYEFGSAFPEDINGEHSVLKQQIGNYPLYIYGIYDTNIISEDFTYKTLELALYFLIAITFSLIFIFLIGNNISDRTKEMVKHCGEIAKGNFKYKSSLDLTATDEIATAEKGLMYLSKQIEELITTEKKLLTTQVELEKQNTQAKILALQGQINPHFLFNSLESIRLKAMTRKETQTATMIKYMAKMFRNVIEWDKERITVKEEVGFLEEYLSVQKYRFEDSLNYSVNVSEEAEQILIPKLLIQPLVENACAHGMEMVSGQTNIEIDIGVNNDKLYVIVSDDGSGIEDEKLKSTQDMLSGKAESTCSIGLSNVHKRLELYFESEYKFEINSVYKEGTVCKIEMPIIKEGSSTYV